MELLPFAIKKNATNELGTHRRAHLVRFNLGFCSSTDWEHSKAACDEEKEVLGEALCASDF